MATAAIAEMLMDNVSIGRFDRFGRLGGRFGDDCQMFVLVALQAIEAEP